MKFRLIAAAITSGFHGVATQSFAQAAGYGGDYQGYSDLYKSIYSSPGAGPSTASILGGTLEAEANVVSLGVYGMGIGWGESAATGDYRAAQNGSFGLLMGAGTVKAAQVWTDTIKTLDQLEDIHFGPENTGSIPNMGPLLSTHRRTPLPVKLRRFSNMSPGQTWHCKTARFLNRVAFPPREASERLLRAQPQLSGDARPKPAHHT